MRITWPSSLVASVLSTGWLVGGCGSSAGAPGQAADASTADGSETRDAGPDAQLAPEVGGYPAFSPSDVPQVVTMGGPVMTAPKVVPIFYAADDAATVASVKDFIAKLPGSAYWSAFASEYGAGPVTSAPAILVTDALPPSYDDAQIRSYLANKLDAGDPSFPQPDESTIYAFFFPQNVTITQGASAATGDGGVEAGASADGGAPSDAGGRGGVVFASCTDFGGYHDDFKLASGADVAYAVVPRCPSYGSLMGIDAITGPASHELAESATDPFPSGAPAFHALDAAHDYWALLLGGAEIGDMCAQGDVFTSFPPSMPYTVQRIWSNRAALAGADPCVPVPAGLSYFNTLPNMPDVLSIPARGGAIHPKGVEIPVGASKTIELDLFSDAQVGPWTVRILDLGFLLGAPVNTYLSASFTECQGSDTCQGQNGDKLHLTLMVMQSDQRPYEPFVIESRLASGHYNLWAGIVGSAADGG